MSLDTSHEGSKASFDYEKLTHQMIKSLGGTANVHLVTYVGTELYASVFDRESVDYEGLVGLPSSISSEINGILPNTLIIDPGIPARGFIDSAQPLFIEAARQARVANNKTT